MNTTTPGSIGGMKVAIACPNMWLSGSRFRNRNGKNGFPHFRYFSDLAFDRDDVRQDVAVGDDDAFGFGGGAGREDDFGDVVARDGDVRRDVRHAVAAPVEIVQLPDRRASIGRRRVGGDVLSDQHQLRRDDAADAREEHRATRGSRSARRSTPRSRQPQNAIDPFGAVLAPEDDLVAFAKSERVEARRERARAARDVRVGVAPAPEPVVVDEEVASRFSEIGEKVNQRAADHE